MRKFISVLLIVLVTCAGCTIYVQTSTSEQTESAEPAEKSSVRPTAIPQDQQSPSAEQQTQQTFAPSQQASVPVITGTQLGYAPQYAAINVTIPVISGLEDAGLQDEINQYFYEDTEFAAIYIDELAQDDTAHLEDYFVDADFSVTRNDGTLLSIHETVYTSEGGAVTSVYSIYFNVVNTNPGVVLSLRDLFIPNFNYVDLINGEIELIIQNDPDTMVDSFSTINEDQNYYLTDNELVIVFGKWEIAAGAAGQPEFRIPFENLSDFINNWLMQSG